MSQMKLKSISKDFILNLIASFVVTGILQLLIYPQLARVMDSATYGVLLTIVGLANTFAATAGSSLNNTRLLLNPEYDEKNYNGNYLPILFASNIVSTIILFIVLQQFKSGQITNIFLVLYMVANATRTYGSVAYRIKINYTKNLISNIFVGVGDLAGLGIILLWKEVSFLWPICFLGGEVCAIAYICLSSDIFKEKMEITPLFSKTIRKDVVLMTTTLTANLLLYLDRLLLLPILGGEAVTTYTVASVFGKSLGILMGPLAGVLLSYFSQKEFKMSRKGFWQFNMANIFVAIIFMIISHFTAAWFTGFFYPTEIDSSKIYLDLANAATIVAVLSNMTGTTVLKFAPSYWLLIIQVSYCVAYLLGGMIAVKNFGLMGFGYVALLSACLKVVLQFIAGDKYVKLQDS